VFEGSSRPSSPSDVRLEVNDAVARVRFVGRYVAPDQAPAARPFVWRPEESLGFLRDDAPVHIEIVADHGGGNPRTVDLAGATNGRFQDVAAQPLWDERANLSSLRRSSFRTENAGLLPTGFAFRLTRIDWRARLLGGEKNSRFDVEAPLGRPPGKDPSERCIVAAEPSRDAPKGQAETLAGTWNGERLIRRADELRVTCHYFGMADVTLFGRLEPVDR
jgi:hypothetical protein